MPKTWSPGDAKKFARQVQLGKSYYTVNSHARNLGSYEDSHTYSEHVFDSRRPITGTPCSGAVDAVTLCQRFGPVYEQPPAGMRNLSGPAPQVAGPLGDNYEGVLDEDEIRGLEKINSQNLTPRQRRALNARRP
jgi:hypothetical protein